MPIFVDADERKAEIAEAAYRVAAREGLKGVTIRAVANELGASTAVVTNYLPTRADLLLAAVDRLAEEWTDELNRVSSDPDPEAALRAAVRASVAWDDEELIRNQFWVAVLAAPVRTAEMQAHLDEAAEAVRAVFTHLLERAGHPDPETAADVVYLFLSGVFVDMVESPTLWTPQRVIRAADALLDSLLRDRR